MARAKQDDLPRYDYLLIITMAALVIVGLMMIYSATFALGYQLHGQATYFFIRQLLWVGLGTLGLIITARIEYHFWQRLSILIMAVNILLLGFVLFTAVNRFGGYRWLLNGSVQPSEFSKLATIIYIAAWLSSKGEQIRRVSYGLIPFAILMGLITGLIVLQEDLSTAMLIGLTAFAMFFIAGGNLWQIIASGILGGATVTLFIQRSAFRLARMTTFLDPLNSDPLGDGYQIRQILIALGSGGLTGLGLGASRQKFGYIPASHTDGIFAILGEELGLIGGLVVLGLFGFLAYRGFRIALTAADTFGTILASGLTCSLIFQAIVNVGVVTASLPFTGVPLPFVSFGGSSLIISMVSVGLLLSVSRRTLPMDEPKAERKESREVNYFGRGNRRTRVSRPRRRAGTQGAAR
ncbi:MAG: putative peptidoglycan glycosyltransferase FtsW [Anaerolineae bacterium]|nr:putative peptidoglycan glycosyltransferase FtsW [Anaerolineae bacterium]